MSKLWHCPKCWWLGLDLGFDDIDDEFEWYCQGCGLTFVDSEVDYMKDKSIPYCPRDGYLLRRKKKNDQN